MNRKWLLIIALLLFIASFSLLLYWFVRVPEELSWLKPNAYVIYEQSFIWNGNSTTDYMVWNITGLEEGYVDLHLLSHGVNVSDGNVELTLGEANLTIDAATRVVVAGSEDVEVYIGEKWPLWIDTGVTLGSTVDIWYGVNIISKEEWIHVLGQKRDCWVVEYDWPSGSMIRWFDKSSGLVLKIHNVLLRQGTTIIVTETAVMTNIDI